MSRYFVTGATGFIGGALARQLRAAGHVVTTIARDPSRAAASRRSASRSGAATSPTARA
jgi:uncharacterized protein YbjT (DUF2867 family)